DLLANAHWIYALWGITGLFLLQVGRLASSAFRFLPIAAITWAVIGWLTHVHVEWVSDRAAQTSRLLAWGIKWPEFFQFAAAGGVVLVVAGFIVRRGAAPAERPSPSCRLTYDRFVILVCMGKLNS